MAPALEWNSEIMEIDWIMKWLRNIKTAMLTRFINANFSGVLSSRRINGDGDKP